MRSITIFVTMTLLLTVEAYGAWAPLAPGMELGEFTVENPRLESDARVTILRIDPHLWQLVLLGKSWRDGSENKTAKQWCRSHKLTAATNAGMFGTDFTTHVGYLRSKGHVNSSHVNKYMSVAAFNPKENKKLPEFRIFDLDVPGVTMDTIQRDFSSVVQNLRLIKRPGENRWSRQGKQWSEAALGEDRSGRVLFIFTRSPFSMHDFNRELLSLGIGLVTAQHLEGGPEAQLYLHVGDVTHEMYGSYETSFRENDANEASWPIPNILGVRPKPAAVSPK